jgi:hypothetical protein
MNRQRGRWHEPPIEARAGHDALTVEETWNHTADYPS